MRINLHSLFSGVNVSQADVDQIPRRQDRFHPGESWKIRHLWQENMSSNSFRESLKSCSAHEPKPTAATHLVLQLLQQEGHGLAVEVPRWRAHRRVQVCVSVNPDDTEVRTPLGVAPHRADAETGRGGTT